MENRHPNSQIAEVFYRLNIGAPIELDLLTAAFRLIFTDVHVKARDSQLGAFLTGLMVRGVSAAEVTALIRTALNVDGVRRYKPNLPSGERLVGVAGSGKKGVKTFNISTLAALTASAAGAYVAKPVSGATSSVSGSRDFLTVVGARLLDPTSMIKVLTETRFSMFPIEELIPRFDSVYGGRMFGPTPLSFAFPAVVNPIACDALLYGLSHPNIKLSLEVFRDLGPSDVSVVCSTENGVHFIDELSTLPINMIGRISGKTVEGVKEFNAEDITGRASSKATDLQLAASLVENAQLCLNILKGKSPGPREDSVAMNAAVILQLAAKTSSLEEGFGVAIEVLHTGKAFAKLKQLVEATGGSTRALSTIEGG